MSVPPEADWLRWAGVAVALAGVVIATPDGIAEGWRELVDMSGRVRDWLARHVPFIHGRPVSVALGTANLKLGFGMAGSAIVSWPWESDAGDARKIEVLHQQLDLLTSEVRHVRDDLGEHVAALQTAIREAEAALRGEHATLAARIGERERRAAQIDARGLWPVWFGILLTGIPGELAAVPVLGFVVLGIALAVTGWLLRLLSGGTARRSGNDLTPATAGEQGQS